MFSENQRNAFLDTMCFNDNKGQPLMQLVSIYLFQWYPDGILADNYWKILLPEKYFLGFWKINFKILTPCVSEMVRFWKFVYKKFFLIFFVQGISSRMFWISYETFCIQSINIFCVWIVFVNHVLVLMNNSYFWYWRFCH